VTKIYFSSSDTLFIDRSITGQAIAREQFPDWVYSDETYLLTCLLHDIGTTGKNLRATLMSFEFYGGLLAHDLLYKENSAPKEQADSVAEAIIRHQDIGESGKITTIGQLIQLATIFGEFDHQLG
jgi:cyanamide hydratase